MAPLAQAEPAEAHTPPSSRRTRRASLSTPSKRTWAVPGTFRSRAPVSTVPPTAASNPSTSRSRCRATAATQSPRSRSGGGGGPGPPPPPDDAGDVVGARPALAFLSAAVHDGPEGHVAPDGEETHTLRASEFVGAEADEVGGGRGDAQVEPHETLHGVGVQDGSRCPSPDGGGDGVEGLDRADLVVDEHHRHEGHVAVEKLVESDEIDDPVAVHGHETHRCRGRRRGPQDGVVLDGGGDDGPPVGTGCSADGQVVGLGAAPGEDDPPGLDPDHVGEDLPGLLDGPPCVPGHTVGPGGIAERPGQPGQHGRARLGTDRRGGGVIEVRRHPTTLQAARRSNCSDAPIRLLRRWATLPGDGSYGRGVHVVSPLVVTPHRAGPADPATLR
jgi:hypothetical protein